MELLWLSVDEDHPGALWMAGEDGLVFFDAQEEFSFKGIPRWGEFSRSLPPDLAGTCGIELDSGFD
jgi:hypothetical protein